MLRLKELRKGRSETQESIAQILGITRGAYANIENGKREPDLNCLNTLATHYSVSIDYLLGRTDRRTLMVKWGEDMYEDFANMRTRESVEAQLAFLKQNGIPDDLAYVHEALLKEVPGVENSESNVIDPVLLNLCRQLNVSGQKKVKEYARDLLDNDKYKFSVPQNSTEEAG